MADRENLRRMLAGMLSAAERLPIIAPLREKAAETLRECLPERADMFHVIAPLSYLEFGYLTANARGIITDSGNVAEEATFNGVPCITLNSYTEHIETVKVGSNVLVGEDSMRLAEAVTDIVQGRWKKCGLPERWDGRSAERIIRCLIELHGESHSRPLSCGKGE